jgi:hypothetical protein
MEPSWSDEGNEIVAILWSFAAVRYLNLPLQVVFHEHGYKGESEWIIQQFEKEVYSCIS